MLDATQTGSKGSKDKREEAKWHTQNQHKELELGPKSIDTKFDDFFPFLFL